LNWEGDKPVQRRNARVNALGSSTSSKWTTEEEGFRVDMQWGAEGDAFDPITQMDEVTVKLDWSGPDGEGLLVERSRQRRFMAKEFDALVRACGDFEIVEWLGSMAAPCRSATTPQPGAWCRSCAR
jgi:hypothetical protein